MTDPMVSLVAEVDTLRKRLERQEVKEKPVIATGWTFLAEALTSTSWDGDAKGTANNGILDLSAVFNVPAGVDAVLVLLTVKDNSSGDTRYVALGPSSGNYSMVTRVMANDVYNTTQGVVPCDANGDIYVKMSGDNIDYVHLSIWGYYQS